MRHPVLSSCVSINQLRLSLGQLQIQCTSEAMYHVPGGPAARMAKYCEQIACLADQSVYFIFDDTRQSSAIYHTWQSKIRIKKHRASPPPPSASPVLALESISFRTDAHHVDRPPLATTRECLGKHRATVCRCSRIPLGTVDLYLPRLTLVDCLSKKPR